jgi:hypothetical protein
MPLRMLRHAMMAAGAALLIAAGVALAAAALPRTSKVYDVRRPVAKGATLTLIVSPINPRHLIAGPIQPPIASQYALSTGAVPCRTARRRSGLPRSELPFALFSFPGATLRLAHGRYRFAVSETAHDVSALGSTAAPFTLRVRITGVVRSATAIAGTITAHGGPCGGGPYAYVARLNPKLKVGHF